MTFDLMGFWLTWHLHGGFEGMQRDLAMSRSAVYRRVSAFRRATGKHPDEFTPAGCSAQPGGVPSWGRSYRPGARCLKLRRYSPGSWDSCIVTPM